MTPLKVLVVDDTIVYRKIVTDVLAQIPDVEVAGTAGNGKVALARIEALKPDLLTLDIEMPEMNGLEVLQHLKSQASGIGVIVVSSLTKKGGDLTIRALELGAFDFITKPEGGSTDDNLKNVRNSLEPLLKAFMHRREISAILKGGALPAKKPPVSVRPAVDMQSIAARMGRITGQMKSEVVGIGISTGGPNALASLLPRLPGDIDVPILLVQHMPPNFTQSLAGSLDAKCALRVKEAEDGELVQNNVVYIAPGGKQMKVALGADATRKIIRVTNDPPENNCKPSVDYLFRSLAHHYVGRSTCVIMTGMGNDGTLGAKLIKRNGSTVIAQNEATCVVFGMPKEAIEAGAVDIVSPLEQIANEIIKTVKR
jgi:two-component system, chemotaxis family, protein-glutamate methylesterase/glutaminase